VTLAADGAMAMTALRPKKAYAWISQQTVAARTQRLGEREPVHCRRQADKRRSRFDAAAANAFALPSCRPSRQSRTDRCRNDLPPESPRSGLAARSNRPRAAPRICGATKPCAIVTPYRETRPGPCGRSHTTVHVRFASKRTWAPDLSATADIATSPISKLPGRQAGRSCPLASGVPLKVISTVPPSARGLGQARP
jgi:hypothetical protein